MAKSKIEVGDKVPAFSLRNQAGKWVEIEQFFGRPFVLYFYPKDDTPGCTAEACGFRDAYDEFRDLDAEVIGVSADSPTSHSAFAKKYDLPFTLLSDQDNQVRKLFGVTGNLFGLLPGRVTYVVDAEGTVRHIFEAQLQAKRHVGEALDELRKK